MKFSIRDLLLVTVIVALAVGWWVDHRSLAPDAQSWRDSMAEFQRHLDRVKQKLESKRQELPTSSAPALTPSKE